MRPARRVFLKRALPALVCMAVVQGSLVRDPEWRIRSFILAQGERAGCAVFRSGSYFITARGPFTGEDLKHRAWNFAWRHASWMVAAGAGFAAGAAVYGVCAWPLGRTRLFGYRGPTLCGACGYGLSGLREPRCPECGREI